VETNAQTSITVSPETVIAFWGYVGIELRSPGNPHILVRYMSIRDAKQFKMSALVGILWNGLMALGAILIELIGRVCFPLMSGLPNADRENLYPVLAAEHLHPG
jgi:Na+/proline symporter